MNANFIRSFGNKFNPHSKCIANSLTDYFKGTFLPALELWGKKIFFFPLVFLGKVVFIKYEKLLIKGEKKHKIKHVAVATQRPAELTIFGGGGNRTG